MVRIAVGLAYRQLTHRGAKLVGALMGVSVAIVLMFTQLGFQGALYDSAVSASRAFDADIILTSRDFQTMAFAWPWLPLYRLYDARGVAGVASASPFYATTLEVTNPRDGRNLTSWLFAFSPDQPVFRNSDINNQISTMRLPDTAIIDQNSRNQIGLIAAKVNETGRVDVELPSAVRSLQPVLKLEGTFKIGPTINVDGNIITSDLNYYRLLGVPLDRVSLGIVRVAKGTDPAVVKHAIEQRLGSKARVFLKEDFIRNEMKFYSEDTPIGFIFDAGLLVGVIVGIVFISQVLHGIVSDNMREYATLRAMGYKQVFFLILVSAIAVAIALITYIPSSIVSYFVYDFAASATKLPMVMKPSYMIEVFLLVVTMGMVATFLSTKKLKQADPVDLF
jgi:putative ABC transport system permease protein